MFNSFAIQPRAEGFIYYLLKNIKYIVAIE